MDYFPEFPIKEEISKLSKPIHFFGISECFQKFEGLVILINLNIKFTSCIPKPKLMVMYLPVEEIQKQKSEIFPKHCRLTVFNRYFDQQAIIAIS